VTYFATLSLVISGAGVAAGYETRTGAEAGPHQEVFDCVAGLPGATAGLSSSACRRTLLVYRSTDTLHPIRQAK